MPRVREPRAERIAENSVRTGRAAGADGSLRRRAPTPRCRARRRRTSAPGPRAAAGRRQGVPAVTARSSRATVASTASHARAGRTAPAAMAPTPIIAARLKTFDPSTTPSPTARSPRRIAATEDDNSGLSAATAVSTPSSTSVKPSLAPKRSSRSANMAAATSVTPRASRKPKAAAVTGSEGMATHRRPDFPAHRE